jgi:hypothetical protein
MRTTNINTNKYHYPLFSSFYFYYYIMIITNITQVVDQAGAPERLPERKI